MATLPRLKPRNFYDLAVEIALIRPGPIQGDSVHPYIRRRSGLEEPITYAHPRLEQPLKRTLGIPLFQEQLMQLAVAVADFSPAEADRLRRAMGSKRSRDKIDQMRIRLYDGMASNGIIGRTADEIYEKIQAFAAFGFAESHSISFALLVYASSWLKRHYPAAFCAALINAQPMGFYSPQSLVHDAKRHGVEVRKPSLAMSSATATLEDGQRPSQCACLDAPQPAVRLGLGSACARSAPNSPNGSSPVVRPTARTRRWPISPGASACRSTRWKRSRPPAHSTASARSPGRAVGRRSRSDSPPGTTRHRDVRRDGTAATDVDD